MLNVDKYRKLNLELIHKPFYTCTTICSTNLYQNMRKPNNQKERLLPEIKEAILQNDDLVNEIRKANGKDFRFLSVQRQLREESPKLCLPHIQSIIRKGLGLAAGTTITEFYAINEPHEITE